MSFNNEEIEYLCKELIDKKLYRIRNYIINDLNCTMFVSNKTDNKYICLETNAFDETEIQICEIEYNCKSTKNLVEFIISFRDNYQYSKVLDSVVNKKEIEKKEKTCSIFTKLCTGKEIENCSVCLEPNTVTTICDHSLCRECFSKIRFSIDPKDDELKKMCPLCRSGI